jgi:hypothetical protein
VFLGLAISTFLFVAAFFRSGVVKYISNGLAMYVHYSIRVVMFMYC